MASSSSTKSSMKLLIDTKNQRVLFAEASKSVIDFLFNLLCLPIGTVMKLIGSNDMVGSLCNLYQSVENLNQIYMQPNITKDVLLNPKVQCYSTEISGFLREENDDNDGHVQRSKLYMYPWQCSVMMTNNNRSQCYNCKREMVREVTLAGDGEKKTSNMIKNGFVKDAITFMVMDDLVIQPMSTISSISLLKKFNIKEIDTLQEKEVEVGIDEGIKLLKASLQSKMVLTSVFLKSTKIERS